MTNQTLYLYEQRNDFLITFEEQGFVLNLDVQNLYALIQHNPATKEEIETLILHIENEVEKYSEVFKQIAGLSIHSDIRLFKDVATLGFGRMHEQSIYISVEQIEQLFKRFSRVVNGYPARLEDIPDCADFAVYLTLIREIMHHWHIEQFVVPYSDSLK